MKLERLTLGAVLKLPNSEDYFTVAKFLQPKNIFKINPLEEQTYGLIKEIQQAGEQPDKMVEFFIRLEKAPEQNTAEICTPGGPVKAEINNLEELSPEDQAISEVLELDFLNFFHQWHWIANGIKTITNREINHLGHEPTPKEEQAGIEELYKFGSFATVDILAGGDPLKYEAIEGIQYMIIFTKLLLEKKRADYQINYNRQK